MYLVRAKHELVAHADEALAGQPELHLLEASPRCRLVEAEARDDPLAAP